jgi:hypothetical protein
MNQPDAIDSYLWFKTVLQIKVRSQDILTSLAVGPARAVG